jgi:hypothetical protein
MKKLIRIVLAGVVGTVLTVSSGCASNKALSDGQKIMIIGFFPQDPTTGKTQITWRLLEEQSDFYESSVKVGLPSFEQIQKNNAFIVRQKGKDEFIFEQLNK